jgi:hypothetical protein
MSPKHSSSSPGRVSASAASSASMFAWMSETIA